MFVVLKKNQYFEVINFKTSVVIILMMYEASNSAISEKEGWRGDCFNYNMFQLRILSTMKGNSNKTKLNTREVSSSLSDSIV